MKSLSLTVAPFNSTLLGALRGLANYYRLPYSDGMLFGLTGHAGLIHIHPQLCPSGPYTWDRQPFLALAQNLGLKIASLGTFGASSDAAAREAIEACLQEEISAGNPPILLNLEFQILTGYDEKGFSLSQPWECKDFPPARLTYGTWAEIKDPVPVDFLTAHPIPPANLRESVYAALQFWVELSDAPTRYAWPGNECASGAYRLWDLALEEHGASHGHWWNAMVWGESRLYAAEYFAEIEDVVGTLASKPLARWAREAGDALVEMADRELDVARKRDLLHTAANADQQIVSELRRVLAVRANSGGNLF